MRGLSGIRRLIAGNNRRKIVIMVCCVFVFLLAIFVTSFFILNKNYLPGNLSDKKVYNWENNSIPYDYFCLIKGGILRRDFDEYIKANSLVALEGKNIYSFSMTWGDAPDWWNPSNQIFDAFVFPESTPKCFIYVKYENGYFYYISASM